MGFLVLFKVVAKWGNRTLRKMWPIFRRIVPIPHGALLRAAQTGDIGTMQLLIEKGADVNAVTATGVETPLMYRAASHNVEAVRLLLRTAPM